MYKGFYGESYARQNVSTDMYGPVFTIIDSDGSVIDQLVPDYTAQTQSRPESETDTSSDSEKEVTTEHDRDDGAPVKWYTIAAMIVALAVLGFIVALVLRNKS